MLIQSGPALPVSADGEREHLGRMPFNSALLSSWGQRPALFSDGSAGAKVAVTCLTKPSFCHSHDREKNGEGRGKEMWLSSEEPAGRGQGCRVTQGFFFPKYQSLKKIHFPSFILAWASHLPKPTQLTRQGFFGGGGGGLWFPGSPLISGVLWWNPLTLSKNGIWGTTENINDMKSLLSWVTNILGSGVVWDDGQVSCYEEGLWNFGEKISAVEVGGEVENGVLAFSTVLWLPFCQYMRSELYLWCNQPHALTQSPSALAIWSSYECGSALFTVLSRF